MDTKGRKGFGEYLRTLRMDRNLTQKEAAEMAGMSAPYLAQVERGLRSVPSRKILLKLADLYKVSPETMLNRAEDDGGRMMKTTVAPEIIEWAFTAVCKAPDFSFGNRFFGKELDLETKAVIVMLYEENTGKKLLKVKKPFESEVPDDQEVEDPGAEGVDA